MFGVKKHLVMVSIAGTGMGVMLLVAQQRVATGPFTAAQAASGRASYQ
jgi:hypothetical protein